MGLAITVEMVAAVSFRGENGTEFAQGGKRLGLLAGNGFPNGDRENLRRRIDVRHYGDYSVCRLPGTWSCLGIRPGLRARCAMTSLRRETVVGARAFLAEETYKCAVPYGTRFRSGLATRHLRAGVSHSALAGSILVSPVSSPETVPSTPAVM